MVKNVAGWLYEIQSHGFHPEVLQKSLRTEISEEEDDLWWEEGLVRVFSPYYDISAEEVLEVTDGRTNAKGDPIGRCSITLSNGDELCGAFRAERTLHGVASLSGSNMEKYGLLNVRGFHRQGVLHGQGSALLAPKALWSHIDCPIHLEGIFNDGCLEGPVRGKFTCLSVYQCCKFNAFS